jgi:hypothetical protein
MTPIRPHDLVRLRHPPVWSGRVVVLAADLALVDCSDANLGVFLLWLPLEFLELVPGQVRLAA